MTGLAAVLMVGLGGGLGALLRWAIMCWIHPVPLPVVTSKSADQSDQTPAQFPLPTFLANLIACAALGSAVQHLATGTNLFTLVAVGFCGGLSTYSTFAVEISALIRDQRRLVALAYLFSSLIGGLLVFSLAAQWWL